MTKVSTTLLGAGIVVAGLVAPVSGSTGAGAATPATPPPAVGPGQHFIGLVNGSTGSATIDVECPGPVQSGQTGHPVAKQTVAIQEVSVAPATGGGATGGGTTGGRAQVIDAKFVPIGSVNGASIEDMFSYYNSLPIATTLRLPCSGTSTVLFWPHPRSGGSHKVRLSVTFQAVCDAGVCSKQKHSS